MIVIPFLPASSVKHDTECMIYHCWCIFFLIFNKIEIVDEGQNKKKHLAKNNKPILVQSR